MSKRWGFVAMATLWFVGAPAYAAELTATEQAWIEAAWPVVSFARQQGLPLDVIVQPQPTPGETAAGMAFIGGRCKLVLSMRGNPAAQATLDSIPPPLFGPIVEAIAAHELGHCWRHVSGQWGQTPAPANQSAALARLPNDQAEMLREMWRTRREEGFADLVGLAWTLRRHPAQFAEVHAWHVQLRAPQELDTGPHDTRVWVRLATDRAQFAPAASIFEQVEPLWRAGLMAWL